MNTPHPGEIFVRFIREYAPLPRQSNMYHEEIGDRAARMGTRALHFEHPARARLEELLGQKGSAGANLILTGTAGDGKTSLLYDRWIEFGGDPSVLLERPKTARLELSTPLLAYTCRFVFDLSKCLPEKGAMWGGEHEELFTSIFEAVRGRGSQRFLIAANDGKLLQALRAFRDLYPSDERSKTVELVEDMLASKSAESSVLSLKLLDLSALSSATFFDRTHAALFSRSEWSCFEEAPEDPAFGSASPLRKNWVLMQKPQFVRRLRTLIELCDVNGFHISVRDVIALLVNGLLGHPKAQERIMTLDEIRSFANPTDSARGGVHQNIFGENLTQEWREDFLVFSYFNYFRVGRETSNSIDELILFGRDLPSIREAYNRLIKDDEGIDPISPQFEELRREYLEAENFEETQRDAFLNELAHQRRRVFFRLPDEHPTFDPWHLTIFQAAGRYLKTLLHPLQKKEQPDSRTVELLVKGLNRIWSGLLFDEGTGLHLTSGLDFTSARISRLSLHFVPVLEDYHGEKIDVVLNGRGQAQLNIHLLGQQMPYPLNLMRFEFLVRVAEGALPNSFSRECFEDVINLKTSLLEKLEGASKKKDSSTFKYLSADANGRPNVETITL